MVNCTCEDDGRVGRRVAVGKDRGTVRYVGEVPPAQGVWLGVEWDDPTRGKHDGTYNNVRFFHTRHPTSGSFVRIEKGDFGRSCSSAIKERYASNQVTLTVEELQDLQKAMNASHVEMVGFEKVNQQQSCLSSLKVVCLRDYQVCGGADGLTDLCPNVRDVDLSSNLLCSWAEVAEITVNFPHLQLLTLSDNRLLIPDEPKTLQSAFRHVKHMVLAHADYTWSQICDCSTMWPQVEQLQVPFNNITNIELPENKLSNLVFLDLEGNSISRWEEINKLGNLERLETLNLCDIGLENICLPTAQNLFKNLKCLLLSDNKIDKWEYVGELDKLPQLEELKFTNNPVLDNLSIDSIHYKIVARIGSLKIVNRKYILREERRGAEIEYLKENGKGWLDSVNNEEKRSAFLLKHPRYPTLVKKHGAAEEYELETKSSSVSSSLVKVKLTSDTKTVTKTLPSSMQLSHLISLVQRIFNTGVSEPILCYHSSKNPEVEILLDSPLKTLDFYSIEEGDEISVRW